MITVKKTISEEFFCRDCNYWSTLDKFEVEFTAEPNEPLWGMIHCPACGGGDTEVSRDIKDIMEGLA